MPVHTMITTLHQHLLNHRTVVLTLLFWIVPGWMVLYAGGWPQERGIGYYKLGQWWVSADQHFNSEGQILPNTTLGTFITSAYCEYGITDRLTAVIYLPFFARATIDAVESATTGQVITPAEGINSIGDIDIALRIGLNKPGRPVAIAATVLMGLPTGVSDGGSQRILQTGDGELNQMLRVDAGHGFMAGKLPAYINIYTGFNHRTQGFSDELRFGAEGGVTFARNRVTTLIRLDGIKSFFNGDAVPAQNDATLFGNNSEYIAMSPEVAVHITEKWGFTVGIGTVLYGKIILARPSYQFGIFFKG